MAKLDTEKKMKMSEFALVFLEREPGANANWFASEWHTYKTGRYAPAASRSRFGLTSAAYRTLRKLRDEGKISSDRGENHFYININAQ